MIGTRKVGLVRLGRPRESSITSLRNEEGRYPLRKRREIVGALRPLPVPPHPVFPPPSLPAFFVDWPFIPPSPCSSSPTSPHYVTLSTVHICLTISQNHRASIETAPSEAAVVCRATIFSVRPWWPPHPR